MQKLKKYSSKIWEIKYIIVSLQHKNNSFGIKNLVYPSSQSAIRNAGTNINENNKSTFHTCSRDKQQDEESNS